MARGTTEMLAHFGYDAFGNAEHLLAPRDKVVLLDGSWIRADGEASCQMCGVAYRLHPEVQGALWLRRSCSGLLVKL